MRPVAKLSRFQRFAKVKRLARKKFRAKLKVSDRRTGWDGVVGPTLVSWDC